MSDFSDTSAGPNLALGTKIAFLVAIPFIAYGIFNLFSPISDVRTQAGAVFHCGTAVSPPSDAFQSNVCRKINQGYMYKGIAFGGSGIAIAIAGYFLFTTRPAPQPDHRAGLDRRSSRAPRRDNDFDDRPAPRSQEVDETHDAERRDESGQRRRPHPFDDSF